MNDFQKAVDYYYNVLNAFNTTIKYTKNLSWSKSQSRSRIESSDEESKYYNYQANLPSGKAILKYSEKLATDDSLVFDFINKSKKHLLHISPELIYLSQYIDGDIWVEMARFSIDNGGAKGTKKLRIKNNMSRGCDVFIDYGTKGDPTVSDNISIIGQLENAATVGVIIQTGFDLAINPENDNRKYVDLFPTTLSTAIQKTGCVV